MGYLTELVKLENGNLRIQLTDEGKAERDEMQSGKWYVGEYQRHIHFWIEEHLGNGWEYVRPEEIGALTSEYNTILSDTTQRDDYGELVACESVWYDNYYAIREPADWLLRDGFVELWPAEVEAA